MMARPHSRLSRHRSARTLCTYREPDSDTDIDVLPTITGSRPARSSRRIQTYREPDTTEDEDSTTSNSFSETTSATLRTDPKLARSKRSTNSVRRSQRTKARNTPSNAGSKVSLLNGYKRQKRSHQLRVDQNISKVWDNDAVSIPVNIRAPPWQALEYHILLRILQYSAYPLYTSAFRSRPSIEWLVDISKLSRSFHEAAMAALLWEPPLLPTIRAHGLLTILGQEQGSLMMNYQTKIRSLDMEVKHLLVKKAGININDLLRHTPLLSHLRIFHGHDEMVGKAIWAEPKVSHFKWCYGRLFDCLDNYSIRLKSFEWNGRFQDTLDAMQLAHHMICMQSLRRLSIVNFNFIDKLETEQYRTQDRITASLSRLQNLQDLEFRNCTILDISSMTKLPLGLRSLKIVNCLSMTSEALESYLASGGCSLRELHLEGNQVMDLGFMSKLSRLCPQLETLSIDLSYEDCSSYRDRNPLYDELLPNGSPTWPRSLISIIVGPLRSLEVTDAEDFYSSLISAADELPYLRVLSIKTILNDASWRDRASLRMKWRPLFEKVFAANKIYAPAPVKLKMDKPKPKDTKRKSARLQEMEELSVSEEPEDGEELPTQLSFLPRQNRCEVVEFELSDQRPAQEQFREADFLDSEPSGDDEWNGRDQNTNGSYAW